MEQKLYVIYNEENKTFISRYEDGEGQEYYTEYPETEFDGSCLFKTSEFAESELKSLINSAGFIRHCSVDIINLPNYKVLPLEIFFEPK